MKKFLIGQLACYGDCLYATTVAKQIKSDYPDSHITWAVATKYKSILELNPHVDALWEIPLINNDYYDIGWKKFEAEAIQKKNEGVYDELVFTQLAKQHWAKFDGTIRSGTLRGYNKSITVSVEPVIRLTTTEIDKVAELARTANLQSFKEVILFEYAPGSGQSFVNLESALEIAEKISSTHKEVCFVLSGPKTLSGHNPQIIDASDLSFRENAELTKYCTLLIGGSSGITWLSTSDWAKKLKMVQLLNRNYEYFAGVKHDFEFWKLPANDVIEITINDTSRVINCINTILEKSFEDAKKDFDEVYRPDYFNYLIVLRIVMLYNENLTTIFSFIRGYHHRNKHLKLSKLLGYGFDEVEKSYRVKFRSVLKRLYHRIALK